MKHHTNVFPTRAVSCPACGANIGRPCILASGKTTSTSHKARVMKYTSIFGGKRTKGRFIGSK